MARSESSSALRGELERAITFGRCAYCSYPGSEQAPLTREHVIPRARGGRRKDVRIIVPACGRCNQLRGCRELVLFLLMRPRRISAFLDHLATLSPPSLRELDPRVLAEVYAAIWMLSESAGQGSGWRDHLQRLCSGRTLHRRRYAARRMLGSLRTHSAHPRGGAPTARVEPSDHPPAPVIADRTAELESVERLNRRLISIIAMGWELSEQEVDRRMATRNRHAIAEAAPPEHIERIVQFEGWRRKQHRRARVDRRHGRPAPFRPSRGRAA